MPRKNARPAEKKRRAKLQAKTQAKQKRSRRLMELSHDETAVVPLATMALAVNAMLRPAQKDISHD